MIEFPQVSRLLVCVAFLCLSVGKLGWAQHPVQIPVLDGRLPRTNELVSPQPNPSPQMLGPAAAQLQTGTMTLPGAIELALRNSKIARVTQGDSVSADPATTYDIEISRNQVIAAMAAFDASYSTRFYSSSINKPPNAFFGPGLIEPTVRDEATFGTGLNKRWLTGAQTSVAFNPDPAYLYLPLGNGTGFNPTYTGELAITATQPLLRGRGSTVNGAPIKIRQIQVEQSAWEFKKAVLAAARSVVAAYWDLHASRVALRSLDEVLPLLEKIVRLQEENFRAEWVIKADVAKAYAQLFDFRQRRVAAQSAVVEAELRLRNLLYLPPADGWTILPITEPTLAPFMIDAQQAEHIAVDNQPDVVRLRLETKIRELEFLVARNGRLPNLDLQALYRMNGVGQDVTGTLGQLFSAEFSDWLVGINFSVPIGNRQPRANMRSAELQLARTNGLLYQEIASVVYRVRNDIRKIEFAYAEFNEAEQRRLASADWLAGSRLRYENPRPSSEPNWILQSLNEYFFSVRSYTEATTEAARVQARYNTAMIELEETKGTLLDYLNFQLDSDPCRQSRMLPLPAGFLPGP